MTTQAIDVAAILTQLRADVQARRQELYTETTHIEYNTLEQQLQRCVEQLEITRVVSAHWPLTGHTLPQRAAAFVNKVVRRYLRWYINPIVEQQNRYNDVVARMLRLQVEAYAELYARLIALEHTPDRSRLNAGDPSGVVDAPADGEHHTGSPDVPLSEANDLSALSFQELQSLVEYYGQSEPSGGLTDIQLRPLLTELNVHQCVHAHWPLAGRTPVQCAIALLHKLVRRYLRWLINPIVEQQNAFNASVTATLLAMQSIDGMARFQLAAYAARKSGCARNDRARSL